MERSKIGARVGERSDRSSDFSRRTGDIGDIPQKIVESREMIRQHT